MGKPQEMALEPDPDKSNLGDSGLLSGVLSTRSDRDPCMARMVQVPLRDAANFRLLAPGWC